MNGTKQQKMNTHTYFPQTEKSPEIGSYKIFLGGTIDQGESRDWQKEITEMIDAETKKFRGTTGTISLFNPRRPDWDPSWGNSKKIHPELSNQINWELTRIEKSDLVLLWFEPNSESRITLLELGLTLGAKQKCIIGCPNSYTRFANVWITCGRKEQEVHKTWEEFKVAVKTHLHNNLF